MYFDDESISWLFKIYPPNATVGYLTYEQINKAKRNVKEPIKWILYIFV